MYALKKQLNETVIGITIGLAMGFGLFLLTLVLIAFSCFLLTLLGVPDKSGRILFGLVLACYVVIIPLFTKRMSQDCGIGISDGQGWLLFAGQIIGLVAVWFVFVTLIQPVFVGWADHSGVMIVGIPLGFVYLLYVITLTLKKPNYLIYVLLSAVAAYWWFLVTVWVWKALGLGVPVLHASNYEWIQALVWPCIMAMYWLTSSPFLFMVAWKKGGITNLKGFPLRGLLVLFTDDRSNEYTGILMLILVGFIVQVVCGLLFPLAAILDHGLSFNSVGYVADGLILGLLVGLLVGFGIGVTAEFE